MAIFRSDLESESLEIRRLCSRGGGGRSQTFAMGASHPECPLTSQAPPPPDFDFLLGCWPLHFANMIKHFFVKFRRKNVKVTNFRDVGPHGSRMGPAEFARTIMPTKF